MTVQCSKCGATHTTPNLEPRRNENGDPAPVELPVGRVTHKFECGNCGATQYVNAEVAA